MKFLKGGSRYIGLLAALFFVLLTASVQAAPRWSEHLLFVPNYYSDTVSVIDTKRDIEIFTIHGFSRPHAIAVSPDGDKVYIANDGTKSISVINARRLAIIGSIAVSGYMSTLVVDPSGATLYGSDRAGNSIVIVDAVSGAVKGRIAMLQPMGLAIDPDGFRLFASSFETNTVNVIDLQSRLVTTTISVGRLPYGLAMYPDGSKLYVANYSSENFSIIDMPTLTVMRTQTLQTHPNSFAIDSFGRNVYVTYSGNGQLAKFDGVSNVYRGSIDAGGQASGASLLPDGSKGYASVEAYNKVVVFDTARNVIIKTIPMGTSPVIAGTPMLRPVNLTEATMEMLDALLPNNQRRLKTLLQLALIDLEEGTPMGDKKACNKLFLFSAMYERAGANGIPLNEDALAVRAMLDCGRNIKTISRIQ